MQPYIHQTLTVGDIETHYLEAGKGPDLVLLHEVWLRLAPYALPFALRFLRSPLWSLLPAILYPPSSILPLSTQS